MKNDFENWKDFPTILSDQSINCYYLKYKDEEIKKGDVLYFQNDKGNFETIIVNKLELTQLLQLLI